MNPTAVRLGKKVVDGLVNAVQAQIDSGDVHENQDFEMYPKLDKWLQAMEKSMAASEVYQVKDYFNDQMKHLDYSRKGIAVHNQGRKNGDL
jgi:hypothetical protein